MFPAPQSRQAGASKVRPQAIDLRLRHQLRKARHDTIAAYAAEMAGTNLDFDRDLESAGIERLIGVAQEPK